MDLQKQLVKSLSFLNEATPKSATIAAEYLSARCIKKSRDVELMFPLAFVVHAYSFIPKALLNETTISKREELVRALALEASADHTFNYWAKQSPLRELLPDDVDDTACAASALIRHNHTLDRHLFLKTVRVEANVGGPYKTWYVEKSADTESRWQDIDPVVNAHFLYMSSLYGLELPQLRTYILHCIHTNRTNSQYYPSGFMFYLYVSRYLHTTQDPEMQTLVAEKLTSTVPGVTSKLDTLLHTLCLVYLKHEVSLETVSQIYTWTDSNGALPALPLCFGFDLSAEEHSYVGNQYASTALLLELLCLLPAQTLDTKEDVSESIPSETEGNLWKQIKSELEVRNLHSIWEYANRGDPYRALTLPHVIARALGGEIDPALKDLLNALALGGFYGWVSYTLFDHIVDREKDVSVMASLPSLQSLMQRHIVVLPNDVQQIIYTGLETTATYYVWEQQYGRFTTNLDTLLAQDMPYTYILNRMKGFTQGLSGITLLLKEPTLQQPVATIMESLVLLEQLNDDIRDLKEDYQAGIMTYALWYTLREKGGKEIDKVLWEKTIPHLATIASQAYAQGNEALRQLPFPEELQAQLNKYYTSFANLKEEMQEVDTLITNVVSGSVNLEHRV